MSKFEEKFSVRWADLDANRHVRNTIFSEFEDDEVSYSARELRAVM